MKRRSFFGRLIAGIVSIPIAAKAMEQKTPLPPMSSFNKMYHDDPDHMCYFVSGRTEPISDVGPWLKDGREWYTWDTGTGKYKKLEAQRYYFDRIKGWTELP